ncbi:hypothetical protein PR048_011577 [Dryococelus australis]|uniref:Uncharacterized protein n=1 Tax=Dryococelus australis TaxID=614101 RepID=A0ABQ9HM49_9NEOP|nr:hypothetical protein PR048_011577 [Dryococelus australis]
MDWRLFFQLYGNMEEITTQQLVSSLPHLKHVFSMASVLPGTFVKLGRFLTDDTRKTSTNYRMMNYCISGNKTDEEDDDSSLTNGSSDLNFTECQSVAYVSGFIANKLMSGFCKDCDVCRGDLSVEPDVVSVYGVSEVHCIIDTRDAAGKLEHPSLQLGHTVAAAVNIYKALLPDILSTDDVGRQLCAEIKKYQDYFRMSCSIHRKQLITSFVSIIAREKRNAISRTDVKQIVSRSKLAFTVQNQSAGKQWYPSFIEEGLYFPHHMWLSIVMLKYGTWSRSKEGQYLGL